MKCEDVRPDLMTMMTICHQFAPKPGSEFFADLWSEDLVARTGVGPVFAA